MTWPSPLKKDRRGAIMVLGIFFACMMIGWMWMLIGLGDAMIWRDRSQEASDAIAYSSAAIQAQGMNLISFINILMLIITAVYLLLSFVFNILDFLHIIFGSSKDDGCFFSSCGVRKTDLQIVSFLPYMEWLNPIANQWCKAADIVSTLENRNTNSSPGAGSVGWMLDKWETVMIDTMPTLSTFEDFVSYATPWAGEVAGVYTATQIKDFGKDRLGVALSATLIPSTMHPGVGGNGLPVKKYDSCKDEECKEPLNCDAHDPNNCVEHNGGDKREGLPVGIPDTGFAALCDVAGKEVISGAQAAVKKMIDIPVLTPILNWIIGFVGGIIVDKMTDSFCNEKDADKGKGLINDQGFADILTTGTEIQLGGLDNNEKCPKNDWNYGGGGANGGPEPCNGVYKLQYKGQNFWNDPAFAGGPHLVVEYAANGNDWMQVWGVVWGGNRVEKAEKLVGVAGMDSSGGGGVWSNPIPKDSSSQWDLYLSQAEFYFDCEKKWEDEDCGKESHASFNIGWRARLRRMHGLSWGKDLLGYVWNGSLGGTFDDKAKDIITGAMGSVFQNPIAQAASASLANSGFQWLKGQAGNVVGSAFNPSTAAPDFIH